MQDLPSSLVTHNFTTTVSHFTSRCTLKFAVRNIQKRLHDRRKGCHLSREAFDFGFKDGLIFSLFFKMYAFLFNPSWQGAKLADRNSMGFGAEAIMRSSHGCLELVLLRHDWVVIARNFAYVAHMINMGHMGRIATNIFLIFRKHSTRYRCRSCTSAVVTCISR